jgi:glutathione S-transferase
VDEVFGRHRSQGGLCAHLAFSKRPRGAGLADENLQWTLSRIPYAERKARWEKMASGGFSNKELSEAYDRISECLKKVDDVLRQGPWLAGRDYSLAYIAMIPFIDRITDLRPDLVGIR